MSEVGIEPTFVGKNENLKFVVPTELFRMRIKSDNKVDHEISKKYSNYLQETFKGFQKGRETKYGNENNTQTQTTPAFWKEFEDKANQR